MRLKDTIAAIVLFVLVPTYAITADSKPLKPGVKDKCPVCGMFVHKYPDWVAEIIYTDASTVFFDGTKDLFKYFFNMKKYELKKTQKDIAALFVTEYYDMQIIDAKSAFFVVGSDVYGPMGRELIPFRTREDAEQFKKDHGGTRIVTFNQVKPTLIKKLD